MALTGEQKKIAIDAYFASARLAETLCRDWIIAAVEAVLAEQARAAEQPYIPTMVEVEASIRRGDSVVVEQPPAAAEQGKAISFFDWWISQGKFIDPDTEDVPWYDKREALCEAAYDAGQSSVRFAEAYKQPAQPPAGDVVERMCGDYGNLTGTDPDPIAMAAALAVAREGMVPKSDYDECVCMLRIESEAARQREGYVSLEDVEKALRQEIKNGWGISADDTHTILWHVRNRLAKPAEQTDEQKVEAILVNALKKLSTLGNGEHPGNSIGNQIAQKALTDAIRLREELKAGKQ